jgi:alkylation response protein AidB-like acyl-CoA dehydrogenase
VDIMSAIVAIEELGPARHLARRPVHPLRVLRLAEHTGEWQRGAEAPAAAQTGEAGISCSPTAVSEPNVGGDLASATVTATLSADKRTVTINGTKRWVTGSRIADYIYTLVRSGPKEHRYRNLSLVLVPVASTGLSIVDIDHHRAAGMRNHGRHLRQRRGARGQHGRWPGEMEPGLADAGRANGLDVERSGDHR